MTPKPPYTRLKALQAGVMDDLCNIYRIILVSGTYGDTTEVITGSFNQACGIHFTGGAVTLRGGQVLLVDYDAVLRLPSSVVVDTDDQIQLVQKGDTAVSGTFTLNSQPRFNSSVQILELKRAAS